LTSGRMALPERLIRKITSTHRRGALFSTVACPPVYHPTLRNTRSGEHPLVALPAVRSFLAPTSPATGAACGAESCGPKAATSAVVPGWRAR
jgi:hypothetical protein